MLSQHFVPLSSVLRSGSLLEALTASLAVPIICEPVSVDGVQFISLGRRDRAGMHARLRRRPDQRALFHCLEDGHGWVKSGGRDIGTWIKVSSHFQTR